MTREKALETIVDCLKTLCCVGEKSAREKAADIIAEIPFHDRHSNEIIHALELAGIDLVERQR